jgi:hypothetical protein
VSDAAAESAVADILTEFQSRPWHQHVACRREGPLLVLEASNDYDADGLALLDEFSDAVCACVAIETSDISFAVRKVESL